MALQGTHRTYRQEEHPTDTETITYPSELDESHPNYDQRGQTVEVPVIIEVEDTVYENCYVKIVSMGMELMESGMHHIIYNYWVYENEQQRIDTPFEFQYFECMVGLEVDKATACGNLFELCYNHLKTLKGFDELTDVV